MKSTTHKISRLSLMISLCFSYAAIGQNPQTMSRNNINLLSNVSNISIPQLQSSNVLNNYIGNQRVSVQALSFNMPVSNTTIIKPNSGRFNTRVYTQPVTYVNKSRMVKPPQVQRTTTDAAKPESAPTNVVAQVITAEPAVEQMISNEDISMMQQNNVMNDNMSVVNTAVNGPLQNANEQKLTVNATTAVVKPTRSFRSAGAKPVFVGSGSSKRSTHRKSKRKKQGSFYYTVNKKFTKLFASTRKGNFDCAKCFAWK